METEDLFAPAWARLDRANQLRDDMSGLWNEYIDTHPFTPALRGQGDGSYVLTIFEEEPPPAELAVATGEWLYNVRSTLDYLVWATAAHVAGTIPPPNESAIQYPIYDNEASWKRNLYRLKGLEDHHRHMLHTMQPFNSDADANYLGWINHLARIDRHRHLNHVTGYVAVLEPVLSVPDGHTVEMQWGERVIRGGHADVARFKISPWKAGLRVAVNPRFGIDPELDAWSGSDFWRRINYSERFRILQAFVSAEIAVYEYDCTGASKKEDLLTEGYRLECDGRLAEKSSRIPVRGRPDVLWSDASPARPTTRRRFDGLDFPPDGPGPVQTGISES